MTIWPSALKAGRVENALQGLAIIQVAVVSQLHLHGYILMTERRAGFEANTEVPC